MKKIILFILFITIYVLNPRISYASENEVVKNQEKYGINNFITNAQNYTDDIDLKDFYKSSLDGKFDNNKFFKIIISIEMIIAIAKITLINIVIKFINIIFAS